VTRPAIDHDLADRPPVVGAQLAAFRVYDTTLRLAELAGVPTLVIRRTADDLLPSIKSESGQTKTRRSS